MNKHMKNIKFDFNDILIKPVTTTDISSRTEINPFDESGFLPLMTAPMDTVINGENQAIFVQAGIIPCQTRGIESGYDGFTAYSLKQFREKFINNGKVSVTSKILIDMANGHMIDLVVAIEEAKNIYGVEMILMVGNIANPETYGILSNAGADYIRIGIGNGGGCLTTQQLGIGYPMGSLIEECYDVSMGLDNPAKIVADGGMKDYSDIIKALALGADYVMIGSILNKTLESASPCFGPNRKMVRSKFSEITINEAKERIKFGKKVWKMFRGMSTKEVQKSWGVENPKTSEGIFKHQEVEYTIGGWTENFESYLRSAMSYTNSRTLKEFCGEVETIRITNNALNRFKK